MKKDQLKSGIYLSYMSIFVTNITNLILTPFLIRNLGQGEYGVYMLIGAFIGYIAVLDFGLGNTTVRFVAKYRAEKDLKGQENFLSITFIIYALISIIVLIIGSIIFINLDKIFSGSLTNQEIEIAETMFIILVINLALTLPMKSFTGIINGYEKFNVPKMLTIARTLSRALLVLILLSLGYKAIAVVLIDAILNLLMMLSSMLYVFKKLKVNIYLHKFNFTLFKEIISFSSLIFVSVIVDQFYWRSGHIILGIIASSSEVAIFSIGMMLGQYFITFSTAISGVFLPRITKMVVAEATGEKLTDLLIKTGRLQFIILGFVLSGFLLFGNKFIFLWAGEGYNTSWIVATIVMIPLVIVLTQTIGISILQAKNMHGFRALVYLFIAVINLFISIILGKIYGIVGVASGTALSLIAGNIIIMNFYYHFRVKLNIPRFFKETFSNLLFSMIITIIISSTLLLISEQSWSILIIQCIIYSIIFGLIVWFLGLNNYEKNLFFKEIKKVKNIKN